MFIRKSEGKGRNLLSKNEGFSANSGGKKRKKEHQIQQTIWGGKATHPFT